MATTIWGQQPWTALQDSNLIALKNKAQALAILADSPTPCSCHTSPELYLYDLYNYYQQKELLEQEQKRLNESKFHPSETASSLTTKIKLQQQELSKQKNNLTIKGLSLAQSMAIQSMKVDNEDIQALLAKEAHFLSTTYPNTKNDPFVYEAVYKALLRLETVYQDNPNFNVLNQTPKGFTRLGRIRMIKIDSSNQIMYTLSSDGLLLKWELNTYKNKSARYDTMNKPQVLAINPTISRTLDISSNGKELISAGDRHKILTTNAISGKTYSQLAIPKGHRIWAVKYVSNKKGIVIAEGNMTRETIVRYQNSTNTTTQTIDSIPYRLTSWDLSTDGKYLAGAGDSATIWIWNLEQFHREFLLKIPKNRKRVTAIAFNPQKTLLAAGYQDGSLMIWDINRAKSDSTYLPKKILHHKAYISDVEFNADGTRLAVGSLDKTATLWSINTSKQYGNQETLYPYLNPNFDPIVLDNYTDWVTSVAFSPNGHYLVTGTANGQLNIWETDLKVYMDQLTPYVNNFSTEYTYKIWQQYIQTKAPTEEYNPRKLYKNFLINLRNKK